MILIAGFSDLDLFDRTGQRVAPWEVTQAKVQKFLAEEQDVKKDDVKKVLWKEGYNLLTRLSQDNMTDCSLPSS